MLLIENTSLHPAFNLALEEYLLTAVQEDVLCLWRNSQAIIIGKNQNTLLEINPDYVQKHNIAVIRRLTGGGAVFHDPGNINYTLIQTCGHNDFNNYAKFTAPIISYLKTLDVTATLSGRNDLLIDGAKCSGNAQTVRNGRILHHGCLLFSADLSQLSGALRPRPIKLQSKGVASVRSRVTNIAQHLKEPMTAEEFLQGLTHFLRTTLPDVQPYELTQKDIAAVNTLVKTRYGTWEWNFGSSPRYSLQLEEKFPFGLVEASLLVAEGRISAITLQGDFFGSADVSLLEAALVGIPHRCQNIAAALPPSLVEQTIFGMTPELLARFLCQ